MPDTSPPTHYLRVEGVNFSSFVLDTEDLSTMRGGGLLLLDAVTRVKTMLENMNVLHSEISTGASSGLFALRMEKSSEVENIVKEVREMLEQKDKQLKHGTFVVAALKAENFSTDKERLLAMNRFEQLQSPSLAVPEKNNKLRGDADVCAADLVRPAPQGGSQKSKKGHVSDSVWARRGHGVGAKSRFYADELDKEAPTTGWKNEAVGLSFAEDFDAIANDFTRGNLSGKLAVIYLDGNKFGNIQLACETVEALKQWDQHIKKLRRSFLQSLLLAATDSSWTNRAVGGCVRLETLMWGGDELMFVVPAWKGWETLELFFRESKNWKFEQKDTAGVIEKTWNLTHAASIVFAHYNAPIQRLTSLARSLAEEAKKVSRENNLFLYEVLESFDHVGPNLDAYHNKRHPKWLTRKKLVLTGDAMPKLRETFSDLKKNGLPTRRVRMKVEELLRDKAATQAPDMANLNSIVNKEDSNLDSCRSDLAEWWKHTDSDAAWLHLALLADYIGEVRP